VALSWLEQVEALFSALCLDRCLPAKADIEVASVIMENMADKCVFHVFLLFMNYSNKIWPSSLIFMIEQDDSERLTFPG